ncbi:ABC transporter ATPase component [Ostreococcus tauri]|uniref:ABC transporter ATPase component n=1 Tax=Ostreococcus tauri TaxID=70448 RepID=A0A1Y5I6D5_OSTTA|nr:ABC transporter ATPase component [Ostreococcus tauri]
MSAAYSELVYSSVGFLLLNPTLFTNEARRAVAVASLEREAAKAAKLDGFITKFGAKATKASAAKSKQKALDKVSAKMEEYAELVGEGDLGEGPGDAKKVILKLPTPPKGAKEILKAKDLDVGYVSTDSTLVKGVNLTVTKGDRILIIGPNGAGKSTLMKTIGGGEGAVIGYFSQDLAQELPTEVDALTHVLDVARKIDKSVTSETARGVLGALGITGSAAVDRTIGSLSGGEKARVALAAFVLRPVNVLLLDEASNHLDGTAIEALCEGLRGWEGAVCAITHNASFAVALNPTVVVRVENGSATSAIHVPGAPLGVGEYDTVERKSSQMDETFKKEAEEAKRRRRALEREAANAPKVIEKIERALAVLDADIETLDAKLLQAGADVGKALEIQKQKDEKVAKQELYYEEWQRLESLCDQLDRAELSARSEH